MNGRQGDADVAKAKAVVDIDKLVNEGLLKIAESESPLRSRGKTGTVYEKATGPYKLAIERLKDPLSPLAVEGESGLKLTPAGFARIEKDIAPERVGAAAKSLADSHSPDEQVEFVQAILQRVPTAAIELEPLLAEAVRRQTEGRQHRVQAEKERAERSAASRIALQKCQEHLQKLESARIEELKGLLSAAGGIVPEKPVPDKRKSADDEPNDRGTDSSEDRDLRRDFAERLVASWCNAVKHGKKDARDYLETLIENWDDMIRIGEEGDMVPFDNKIHADLPGLPTGFKVRITRSGWALEIDEHRRHVIEKALVAK